MLAAFLVGPRQIQLKDIKKPNCGPSKILLSMKATAICGSDIKQYRAPKGEALPLVMGHEATGTVIEKGQDVKKFEVGDRVVVQPSLFCSTCLLCSEGRDNICLKGDMIGGHRAQGGFAEYLAVDEENAFRLPSNIGYIEGTQIQTLATVYHSQRRLQLKPGQGVLVIGLGATGLLHVQLARASGATPIIGVDLSPKKVALAKELGADISFCLPDDSALIKIKNATRGDGPQTVIEAVGIASTVALSIESVAPGGKVLMFGSGSDPLTGFDPFLIYYKEISIIGTRSASKADWQPSIDLVESGHVILKSLITHQVALKDVKKAFALMDEGAPGLIRIAVLGANN